MVERPGRGTPDLTCRFTGDPLTIRDARHALASALQCEASLARDVVLVASELMSNARAHTAGDGRLDAWVSGDDIVVEVHDADPTLPPWPPAVDGRDARGLVIVDGIATAWGSEATDGGKVVWAQFRAADREP
jgi:hypothetical protein